MTSIYTITKKRFLDWLISDHDDIKYWGNRFITDLKKFDEIAITTEELFLQRDSLPGFLFERQFTDKDRHLVDEEISIKQIKLISKNEITD